MVVSNAIGLTRELIELIRVKIPQFENRVGGVSEFAALREITAELALPYCFVVPIGRKVIADKEGNTSLQKVKFLFSTVLALDNAERNKDTKSLTAMEQVEFLYSKLLYALIGFDPESVFRSSTIMFVEDFIDDMTHKRLWWNIVWAMEYYIDVSNPDLCPADDDYTITTVYSRGYNNGYEPDEDETEEDQLEDYNTKNEDGLMEGGDGVVSEEDL